MNMTRVSEIEKIKSKIVPVLKEHNVTKAGIFGSFARGEQKKRSDIDILVKVKDNWGLTELIGLKLALEKAVSRKVDIVEYETIKPRIKDNILNDEVPII